jgi:4'-phosphopantetheinyl transferase
LAEWPEFDFSISHCGPYVGVAFADAACGLDLEVAGRSVDLSVARRFAAVERDYILTAPPALAPERFLEVWVKKEAYLKWLGQGLGAGLGSFSVLDPGRLGVTFARLAPGPRGDLVGWVCLGGAGPNDSDLEPAETLSQDWITIPG